LNNQFQPGSIRSVGQLKVSGSKVLHFHNYGHWGVLEITGLGGFQPKIELGPQPDGAEEQEEANPTGPRFWFQHTSAFNMRLIRPSDQGQTGAETKSWN
jgi:hypothetical protein